jgi:hypothetical protein
MKKLLLITLFFSLTEILMALPRDFKSRQLHVSSNPNAGELNVRLFYRGDAAPDDYFQSIYLTLTYNDGITNNASLNLLVGHNPSGSDGFYSNGSGNGNIRYNKSVYNSQWYDDGDASNHPGDRDGVRSSYDSYYFVDYTFYIPAEAFNHDMSLNLTGKWTENGSASSYQPVNENYPISQSGFGKPRNFTIDNNFCDKVILNWDPTNSITPTPNHLSIFINNFETTKAGELVYDVYKGSSRIATDITATTYTVNSLGRGEEHTYKVVQKVKYIPRFKKLNGITRETYRNSNSIGGTLGKNATDPITSKTFENTDAPSNIIYDRTSCSGDIQINWNYSASTNPDNFEIYRYDPAILSVVQDVQVVNGSATSYTDNTATSGAEYIYKVKSRKTCPEVAAGTGRSYPTPNYEEDYAFSVSTTGANVIANGTPAAVTVQSLNTNSATAEITVDWNNADNLEEGYIITRQGGNSGQVNFTVGEDVTTYIDNSGAACELYDYTVKAQNTCNTSGVNSTNSKSTYLPSSIEHSFDASNNIQSSDGEFGDRVEIKWKPLNRQAENWYINRINPAIPDTTLIAVVDGKNRFYTDRTADANTIYQYEIYGDADCASNIILSDTTIDNGFRLGFGTVNGQVTYQGGTASKDVKVVANAASGLSGMSGLFNGTDSYIDAANLTDFQNDSMTFMAWIKPTDLSSSQVIASKEHKYTNPNQYFSGWNIFLSGSNLGLRYGGNVIFQNPSNPASITTNSWVAVGFSITTDSAFLYINGNVVGKVARIINPTIPVNDLTASLHIGSGFVTNTQLFSGNIDEVKYYNKPLTQKEFKKSTNVFVNPSQANLKGYWRFDEGFGDIVYDYSKTLQTANRNHAQMVNVTFDNDKPSSSLLTAGAYTDSTGSYFIPFIPYLGVGDNFTITPSYGTHSFTPVNTALFIGGTSPNFTGKDFQDNSSFEFNGTVKYATSTTDPSIGITSATTCTVSDVFVKIDGEIVIQNGEPVKTNDQGEFKIRVPIGEHVVSIEKQSHKFLVGKFPPNGGAHNFQAPASYTFYDSTQLTVIGRVAGGLIQKELPGGLNKGKNNIGIANLNYTSTQGLGCHAKNVSTDTLTGEYLVKLYPLNYEISEFSPKNNPAIKFLNGSKRTVDLSIIPPVQYEVDSVITQLAAGNITSVDSAMYHKIEDFIYFNTPSISMVSKDLTEFTGDEKIGDTMVVADLGLPYPIFTNHKKYEAKIVAGEVYTNTDNSTKTVYDSIPVQNATIVIKNDLARKTDTTIEIKPSDSFTGILSYNFIGGKANPTLGNVKEFEFSSTIEINMITPQSSVAWKPDLTVSPAGNFRGIMQGSRALGSNFITEGPQVVTMILRDPPGSNSFSTWQQNTTTTTTTTIGLTENDISGLDAKVMVGTQFSAGLGVSVETDVNADISTNVRKEVSVGEEGQLITTTSNTVDISTGATDEFVGSDADLFFGHSENLDIGKAENVKIVLASECPSMAELNFTCGTDTFYLNGNKTDPTKAFQIAKQTTLAVAPKSYGTEFFFTQRGIESILIPELIATRNAELLKSTLYTRIITDNTNDLYGSSNDDPRHGANASTLDEKTFDYKDSTGSSYIFKGFKKDANNIITGQDKVWWYNQQIRLWKETLAENEKAKVQASNLTRNISYQSGGSISYSTSNSSETARTQTFSTFIDNGLASTIGAESGGIGAEVSAVLSFSTTRDSVVSKGSGNSTSFSYTINDLDDDDQFTVDVFKSKDGYGSIFKTRAGQTSCPYQGEEKTKYYQPGTVINIKTEQLEQPAIDATTKILTNIPSDGEAVFTLALKNLGKEDAIYDLRVIQNTNPNGAILKIDGTSPDRAIPIPAGATVNKILTVKRGSTTIKYENIGISLQSQCQYASGTAGYKDIDSTIYISASFVPSCTDLEVSEPGDLFVLNNLAEKENTIPIEISNFDVNYFGMKSINLEYKAINNSAWSSVPLTWLKTPQSTNINESAIPTESNTIYFDFTKPKTELPDGQYQFRAFSTCEVSGSPDAKKYSNPINGVIDRTNPSPFGTPTPADGTLDPNDDISIEFNEAIQASSLSKSNMSLTGVVNGQPIRHDKSIAFNGTSEYLEIPNGFNFSEGDFTIEFWYKPSSLSVQPIISQGSSTENQFYIGFNTNGKMVVQLGTATNTVISNSITLENADLNKWFHFSIAYDRNNSNLELFKRSDASNQVDIFSKNSTFTSGGKTFIGKNSVDASSNYLNGSLHNVRIWNKAFGDAILSGRSSLLLNGRELGLIGYWPMNEGYGDVVNDIARGRSLVMTGQWEMNPQSYNLELPTSTSKTYLVADTAGTLSITEEMDMTVEFWFKTDGGSTPQSFLSNGSGMQIATDVNRNGWNFEMATDKKIMVYNNDNVLTLVDNDFADNEWHHFAFVLNRRANATAYIDGVQQRHHSSSIFKGFGADKLAIGARYSLNGTTPTFDNTYAGRLDEIRIWNSARLVKNIELNRHHALKGTEIGLLAYYPFESYSSFSLTNIPNGDNQSSLGNTLVLSNNGVIDTTQYINNISTPLVSLPPAVSNIQYNFNLNNDKIVITPTEDPSILENVTMYVSVKNVQDLRGNIMVSPKSWIAYVNKNQTVWQNLATSKLKELNDTMTFTNNIVNSGGEIKQFTLENLPEWLSASQTSGTVTPLSSQTITFTVDPNVAIGDYAEDVHLRTDHGFDEKFQVNLKVRKTTPTFTINPANFQNSMSFIAQISINDRIATNNEDLLIAFDANNQVRGVAQLQYEELLDRFMVYLDVYGNINGTKINFKVWNSRNGELHSDVKLVGRTPDNSVAFAANGLIGNPSAPQRFNAIDYIEKDIPLKKGWNWVSFPLLSENQGNFNDFFKTYNSKNIREIKTIAQKGVASKNGNTWRTGNQYLNKIENTMSYLVKIDDVDTLRYFGFALGADTVPVSVASGWNRIGFVSLSNMPLARAMSNYNAEHGDLLKSQSFFAYYDSTLGWVGSLTTMKPTEGYLLNTTVASTFTYPLSRISRLKASEEEGVDVEEILATEYNFDAGAFENTTSAIVTLECKNVSTNQGLMLAAYHGKDIRGLAKINSINEENRFYLTVHGNENETFNYVLMDPNTNEQVNLDGSLVFTKNALSGTPNDPLVIQFKTVEDCEKFETKQVVQESLLSPNPFRERLTITLPTGFIENAVIDFIDASGRTIATFNSNGRATIALENEVNNLAALSSGTYFIRISNNDEVKFEKAIKL